MRRHQQLVLFEFQARGQRRERNTVFFNPYAQKIDNNYSVFLYKTSLIYRVRVMLRAGDSSTECILNKSTNGWEKSLCGHKAKPLKRHLNPKIVNKSLETSEAQIFDLRPSSPRQTSGKKQGS